MLYEMCIKQGQKIQNKCYHSRSFPAFQLTVVHRWYVYVEGLICNGVWGKLLEKQITKGACFNHASVHGTLNIIFSVKWSRNFCNNDFFQYKFSVYLPDDYSLIYLHVKYQSLINP